MAFFKFRKGGDKSPARPQAPESIEAMRRRARHRLIGAGVLVLIGVIGFPLLFDTQPRPIAVDIPIEIPDRDKVKPLAAPPQRAAQPPVASGPVTLAPAPVVPERVAEAAPAAAAASTQAPVAAKPEAKAEPTPEAKPESKPAAQVAPQGASGAKTQTKAVPEAKPVSAASTDGRFVVQVGAFADPAKARAARLKVERAGLKTYTHEAQTRDGKRVRVRVGPFGTRAEADKAADKVKRLDLPAAILTL